MSTFFRPSGCGQILWVTMLALAGQIRAFADEGTSAGAAVLRPVGARAAAMGEAYTAVHDDVFGILYNPATPLEKRQAGMLYQSGYLEDRFGVLGVGFPLQASQLAGFLTYYDGGSITLDDMAGNVRTVHAQTDMLATLSGASFLTKDLTVGGSLKYYHSTLAQEVTGTAYLADLGAQWRFDPKWRTGVAIQNVGSAVDYGSERSRFPVICRLGVARSFEGRAHKGVLAADLLRRTDSHDFRANVGTEYRFGTLFALRAGYRIGRETAHVTTGFGFAWDSFTMDYALIPQETLTDTHRISVTMRF